MNLNSKLFGKVLISAALVTFVAAPCEAQRRSRKHPRSPALTTAEKDLPSDGLVRLRLVDGTLITVEDAWESPQGIWYRQGGISHLVSKDRVKAIQRPVGSQPQSQVAADADAGVPTINPQIVTEPPVWIFLVGGARVEVDSISESTSGVWYQRGPLSIFIERSRIDRIERESPETLAQGKKDRGWSTGRPRLDALIRQSGVRHGVDPYLIFCVMEQESHFNPRAVSPKGAQGLMQLMPGTSARFGVRRPFDPAQNIAGGTRYLKLLLERFKGRVDLVLASYNAGEGAVARFGNRVPPYSETRNYVKRISHRYGKGEKSAVTKSPGIAPNIGGR
jgi:Zn-finger nucleic acid-binding protein